MKKSILALSLLASFALAAEINIYSARHYDADSEIYKLFEAKTGIKVNATQAKAGELIKKLETQGDSSVADLFITADAGNFYEAKNKGVLAPVKSEILNKIVPEQYRDDENQWFAISKRARIIAYDKRDFDASGIKNYEDLAKPELKGKLLIRSATAAYSKSLLASIIEADGKDEAVKWAKGTLQNLARDPKGGDRDQAKAIYEGVGDVAVMNTYYIGLMLTSPKPEDVEAAKNLGIIFPNQDNRGTHVNISGIALTKASKNRENAIKFMEFLVSPEAQKILAGINYEYPINSEVEPSDIVKSFGKFKEDSTPLYKSVKNTKEAVKIYDMVGWK
ncbi:Fe(3+) ABC transporter substrate-binding protein [Campylobacter mucosalis]|uniref:Fe(3+) ABC transporter substrate-binding protein n=1 Tax=Campylobacter mucosalis TaxID=202 RepID=UPI0004D5B9B7|nr:Fe(3+) ABC transporter substrate-binding protein [Campylobacter mucosalis]KEA45455.1 iron deficiency-induced protein A [Campylobacter mucosalis]QKF63763.1 iron(III)/spermidine/putrescine ABC transporter, periplasmic substrate-binding protein [Campylobacter mucosalis]